MIRFFFTTGEMQNPQRMLRALEVKLSTGKSILDFHSGGKIKRDFEIKNIVMDVPRDQLYENINHRVDMMMEEGLLAEAEKLFPFRHLNALQTVGYKELFDYFEGKISLDHAVAEIKKNTRRFAKRQITWFKKFGFDCCYCVGYYWMAILLDCFIVGLLHCFENGSNLLYTTKPLNNLKPASSPTI